MPKQSELEIRELGDAELAPALALAREVFLEFEAPDYPPEGLEEFLDYIALPNVINYRGQGEFPFWGCFEGGQIVGMLAARSLGHVSLLFVKKSHHRQGIARALLAALLERCRARGVGSVTVNASPYGHQAYRSLGFADTGGEQLVNGLRFIPMELRL